MADWLDGQGWEYSGLDSRGHTIWMWPASGQQITLPETPHGSRWQKITRAEVCKVMGVQLRGKRHRHADTSRTAMEQVERKREADRAAILAQRAADLSQAQAARTAEARRQRAAAAAEAEYRREREITALMMPGGAS